MIFRAYLDTFNDNYNASHNEFNYNGRGEMFYTYNNFRRDINLSFKIAAQSRHEMYPLYRKLNYLVSNVAPEYDDQYNRIRTPFMRLTVGSYLDRVPGILTSTQISWDKDYPWEIAMDSPEKGMDSAMLVLPHVLNVTVNFTPIHSFLPQKGIQSPFILPHADNVSGLREEQQWYAQPIANNVNDAKKSTQVTAVNTKKYNGSNFINYIEGGTSEQNGNGDQTSERAPRRSISRRRGNREYDPFDTSLSAANQ